MGGCLSQPNHTKKSQIKGKPNNKNTNIQNSQSLYQSNRLNNALNSNQNSNNNNRLPVQLPKPKYQKTTILQILSTYKIQQTLNMSTRMQGPKYISNVVDGSGKVMRIYNSQDISQEKLDIYKKIIQFQAFQDQQMNFVVLDNYCSGGTISQYLQRINEKKQIQAKRVQSKEMKNSESVQQTSDYQQTAKNILSQVYLIIQKFHKEKQPLGCLTIDSFRFQNPFQENSIRLVDFNISEGPVDSIGFAHNEEGYQADWQFFGYLIKYLTSTWSPIFIAHKMQYSSNNEEIILDFLKGKKVPLDKLLKQPLKYIFPEKSVVNGYAFRRDINKLMKIRKKRKSHNKKYYDIQVQQSLSQKKSLQQTLYRKQTQRVMKRIQSYIQKVDNNCQEPFMMYCKGGQKFRKLKEVFLIKQVDKKMDQLRQILSTIR